MAHRNNRRRETSQALLNAHSNNAGNNNLAVNDPSLASSNAATAANGNGNISKHQQTGRQRNGKPHGTSSSSMENNLAFVLIGIVIMHIACHTLRVFLAGMAVHLISDTVYCMREEGGYVPPLWSMCAESVSSLLIMVNFSGNFLIYCSVLKPFKAAVSRLLHRWKENYPHGIEMMNSNVSWGGGGGGGNTTGGVSRATPEPAAQVSKAGIFSKARTLIMRSEGPGATGKEPVATFTSIVSMSSEKKRKMMACPKERTRAARIAQTSLSNHSACATSVSVSAVSASAISEERAPQQHTSDVAGSISLLVPTASATQQEEAVVSMVRQEESERLLEPEQTTGRETTEEEEAEEEVEANDMPSSSSVAERAISDSLSQNSTDSCSSLCERQSGVGSSGLA